MIVRFINPDLVSIELVMDSSINDIPMALLGRVRRPMTISVVIGIRIFRNSHL